MSQLTSCETGKRRTYEAVVLVYHHGVVPLSPDALPIDMRDTYLGIT